MEPISANALKLGKPHADQTSFLSATVFDDAVPQTIHRFFAHHEGCHFSIVPRSRSLPTQQNYQFSCVGNRCSLQIWPDTSYKCGNKSKLEKNTGRRRQHALPSDGQMFTSGLQIGGQQAAEHDGGNYRGLRSQARYLKSDRNCNPSDTRYRHPHAGITRS